MDQIAGGGGECRATLARARRSHRLSPSFPLLSSLSRLTQLLHPRRISGNEGGRQAEEVRRSAAGEEIVGGGAGECRATLFPVPAPAIVSHLVCLPLSHTGAAFEKDFWR